MPMYESKQILYEQLLSYYMCVCRSFHIFVAILDGHHRTNANDSVYFLPSRHQGRKGSFTRGCNGQSIIPSRERQRKQRAGGILF